MSDAGNQFHYFRLSADDRILWGGYDAIYHPGNAVKPAATTAARRRSTRSRGTSSRRSPSSTGSGSRTAGAARSTPRPGSASRSARRWAGASTTRWATPAWASARPAGRPGSCATWLLAARLGPAPAPVRALAPVPDPAGARPHARGRAHAPVGDRRGRERGPPRAVPPGDGRAGDRLRLVGSGRWPSRAARSRSTVMLPTYRTRRRRRGLKDRDGARPEALLVVSNDCRSGPSAPALGDLMVSRTTPARPRRRRRSGRGRTQRGSSVVSVTSGSEPWPMSSSWNALMSNRSPSRASSSWRSRRISRIPVMYERACPGHAM